MKIFKVLHYPLLAFVLIALGSAGKWLDIKFLMPNYFWFLAVGSLMIIELGIQLTFYSSGTKWPEDNNKPKHLKLVPLDYIKALTSWVHAFRRTYVIEPGLYYTGDKYDPDAPLIATSNYHLTVFLVLRHLQGTNTRLLVVDTDGINVWCAAGKGQFGNTTIKAQLNRYDTEVMWGETKPTLILPKFGLAGVNLSELQKSGVKPVIGPLYAKDLPKYLFESPYRDRSKDMVVFGLKSRIFTWLPGFMQTLFYAMILILLLMVITGGAIAWGVVVLMGLIATLYPFFFPWIPGKRFAVKGLWLSGFISVGLLAMFVLNLITEVSLLQAVPFALASGLFFGLSYTGNSAVSNYSRVRVETARFLPITVVLYIISLAAMLMKGV